MIKGSALGARLPARKVKTMNTSPSKRVTPPAGIILSRIVAAFCATVFITALLACVAVAQSGRAQRDRVAGGSSSSGSQDTTQRFPPRGNSTVTGRVLYEETGEPVKGARVRISSRRGTGPAGATLTNERGEFRFDNLAAGEYYVIATPADAPMVGAATFALPLPTGDPQADDAAFEAARMRNETGGGGSAAEVSVADAQAAQVEIRVARRQKGGQISGRVTYEDGKPAANAQLTFLNRNELRGRMVGPTKLTVLTDERGGYRIGGLPPGDYIVSARLQETRYVDKQGRTYGGLVILTYYPSAVSRHSAVPVHVAAEEELSDINITLVKRSTHTVGGTVVSRRSERRLAGLLVRLRNREDLDLPFSVGADDRFTQTDAEGRFSFEQVMDGDYVISVGGGNSPQMPGRAAVLGPDGPRAALPPRMRDTAQWPEPLSRSASQSLIEKRQELTVAGADVNDLSIELSEGGRVSGMITIEGEGRIPPRLLITSEMRPGERRPSAFIRPAPDGTFTITGLPEGPLSLDVIISPPQRLFVKSITANGVDIRREPLQIVDGTDIRDVQIVLSSDVATLTGRVLSPDGTPLQGATVLLAPADAGVGPMSRGRLVAVTGSGGRFIIEAGPGEYRAVVWSGLPPSDAEALKALAERAPRLSLQAGERKEMELIAPGAQ
jgi:Carboxypeptidase regulatory-like domain